MCFSASASFTSGIVISAIGVAAFRKAETRREKFFAFMPVFFALQQFAEGCVWLALGNSSYDFLLFPASRYFIVMADVAWPVFVPLSILLLEESEQRRKSLKILLGAGILLGSYYMFCILTRTINPVTNSFHIDYKNDFPAAMVMPAFIVYLVVTIAPLFISTVKRMHVFGIIIFVACFVSGIFYTQYLTSVWCFFAALASMSIYWILAGSSKKVEDSVAVAG